MPCYPGRERPGLWTADVAKLDTSVIDMKINNYAPTISAIVIYSGGFVGARKK